MDFDTTDAEFIKNPYPFIQKLRERDPVFWSERFQSWFLLDYDDVVAAFRNPTLSNQRMAFYENLPGMESSIIANFVSFSRRMINMKDPPEHTVLRKLANKGFSPASLKSWWETVETVIDDLLAGLSGRDSFDAVTDYANLLPSRVLFSMFEVPDDQHRDVQRWSDDYGRFFGGTFGNPVEDGKTAEQATLHLKSFFTTLYEERRGKSGTDLLSRMLEAIDDESTTPLDVVAQCVVILFGGHVTVANQLCNGLHALLTHPEELALLRGDPGLISSAVDEIFRYCISTPYVHRFITEELTIGGHRMVPGQLVFLGMGPANHDPKRFPNPEKFDITRNDAKHTGYGLGTHYCLGAPLAQRELERGILRLLETFPDLALDPNNPPELDCASMILRGFNSLPLVSGS